MSTNSCTYMIVLDAATIGDDYDAVARFITTNAAFHGWWNHLPYTFLVSTDQDVDTVVDSLRPVTKKARFLVMEVNPRESEGRLPRAGWEWIRLREAPSPLATA